MATPTTPEKRLLAAGAVKGTTWGTAAAVGANTGILITGDGGIKPGKAYMPSKEADAPFVRQGDLGPHDPVDFAPAFDMHYDPTALGLLIAQLFGTSGAPAQQGATAAYLHTLQWADSISGKFSTFVVERMGKIFEVPSAKPYGLALSVGDGLLKGSMNLRGNLVKDDSAVNTATQVDAITYDDRDNRALFTEGEVKMNAQGGADVSGEDALVVNDLQVEYNRPLDAEHVAGSDSIIEPLEPDQPAVKVTLGFPRMSTINDDYFQDFNDETLKKMTITFTGSLIADPYYYYLKLWFPQLRIVDVEYAFSEIVPAKIVLAAEEPSAAPTGMDYARPYLTLMNKKTADYQA